MGEPLKFKYKNWRGNVSNRSVIPIEVIFTSSSFHGDKEQWFLKAIDTDKNQERMFLMKDIQEFL